jgi:glycosyltransferase involved in cell wall biosynthesis
MKRVCASFRPDLVYVWNAASISTSIIFIAQTLRLPVCYFVSDSWLSRWQTDAGYSLNNRRPARLSRRIAWRPVESLLRRVSLISDDVLDLTHVQFASAYLKKDALRAGKPVTGAEVVHWGIDTTRFAFKNEGRPGCRDRLLYAGQLVPHKGVQTALQALKSLLQQPAYKSLNLTIVGGPDYGDDVQNLVSTLGLQAHVRLTGMVPRADLPRIYREHDILIFPSIWEEPFSITLLEAMSSGLAVVATSTGGSTEILSDNENAIVFRPRDAAGCAYAIRRLVDDGELCETLRHNGRRAVEQHFTLNQMLDKVERSLIYCFEQATLRRETGETRHRIDWQPKAGES